MDKSKYILHVEEIGKSKPRPHEQNIAEFLTDYFESDIIFMRRSSSKTPDLYILKTNICWELKSPTGGGKRTIQNNLRNANSQSENIILDITNCKLTERQVISRINEILNREHLMIRRLKLITKRKKVLTIIDK